VLVRPDGYVAWRAHTLSPDPAAALGSVLRAILGLQQPAGAEARRLEKA
jgi:hypothetical protein